MRKVLFLGLILFIAMSLVFAMERSAPAPKDDKAKPEAAQSSLNSDSKNAVSTCPNMQANAQGATTNAASTLAACKCGKPGCTCAGCKCEPGKCTCPDCGKAKAAGCCSGASKAGCANSGHAGCPMMKSSNTKETMPAGTCPNHQGK